MVLVVVDDGCRMCAGDGSEVVCGLESNNAINSDSINSYARFIFDLWHGSKNKGHVLRS